MSNENVVVNVYSRVVDYRVITTCLSKLKYMKPLPESLGVLRYLGKLMIQIVFDTFFDDRGVPPP